MMSHQIFKKRIFDSLGKEPVFVVLIDNLRFDQWAVLKPLISEFFNVEREEMYYSILPTATHYARNAIFIFALLARLGFASDFVKRGVRG